VTRVEWVNADFAAAMIRHVEINAKHATAMRDGGITSEAFYRGGDNPTSLRVWPTGSWSDARANTGGGAKEYARTVAGLSLPDFMASFFGGSPVVAKPSRPKRYLTNVELSAFARATLPIGTEHAGIAWMERRGIIKALPRLIEKRIASSIHADASLPWWAKTKKQAPWAEAHRIVVGLFDAGGVMRSVHARRVVEVDDIKTASPAGITTSGLVMADRPARALLRGEDGPRDILITEGIASWLAAAGSPSAEGRAVFGILSGGWCEGHASRLPDGAKIIIDVDHDKAGDAYADHILSTLTGRDVTVARKKRAA